MNSSDYNMFLKMIKQANDRSDKDALIAIRLDMIKQYGSSDSDVQYLIRQFKYSV